MNRITRRLGLAALTLACLSAWPALAQDYPSKPIRIIAPFPAGTTPIEGLALCGAGSFPGIGVPPVAVSGAMAAHSFVPVARHKALLDELDLRVLS